MGASSLPVSAAGVARAYAPWLDHLVLDDGDRECVADVRDEGAAPVLAPIIMKSREDEIALARRVLGEAASR
jgi:hypothetical protein